MIPIKPNDVFWSDEQWQAIHESGKNILVNAGAGSGKTAVLTQRIIEILKKGISLDGLIVLTFTKAAASEMKERVRKELSKLAKDDKHLEEQLNYIDQSAIQTFDAFALALVKRYHYLLNVNKSINIGDTVLLSIKRKEIISEVFDELYEKNDNEFLEFIDVFTVKNDNLIQEYIYKISKKIDLLTNSEKYLKEYIDEFYNDEYIQKRIEEFNKLITFDLERISLRLANINNIVSDSVLIDYYEKTYGSLSDLLSSKTYKGFLANIEVNIPRMPARADEDEKALVKFEIDEIRKLLKKVKESLTYSSEVEMIDDIISTKNHAKVIIRILEEVTYRLNNYKASVNLYEFLDVAKLAIRLFEENEELRSYYKNNIYEILIDEYQDTSDIQEILINLIANNNLYMVGDMKQSIYRFRNANPDIFKNKYELYKNEKGSLAIDLAKNFRSREEVLNNINEIFTPIMSYEIGGVNYDGNHELVFGNLTYSENVANSDYNLDILTYGIDESELSQSEKEAFIVAKDIKSKIESKYKIFDKDKKLIRDCKFSDFTILVSEKSKFELYKKIFEYLKLPLIIHKEEDFVRSKEIYVLKNILRAVNSLVDYEYYKDNFKDSVFSILRSFLVEASDVEISKLFLGNFKEGLKTRFNDVYLKLTYIEGLVDKSTLADILAEIYKVFDVYYNAVKIGNVEETENKLNYLLTRFTELDKIGYNLLDAINYLEVLINDDLDIEFSAPSIISDDAINMMSIHKSKGLEFPICYYVELSSRFRLIELNDRILFDKDYGIIIPTFSEGLKDTIYKSLLRHKYLIEEISERLRVLYVALSRAKEKLIIVCEDFSNVSPSINPHVEVVEKLNYNSFYSILNSIAFRLSRFTKPVLVEGTKDYENKLTNELVVPKTKPIELRSVIVEKKLKKRQTATKSIKALLSKSEIEVMEFGTLVHEYLELLDYKKDIRNQLSNLEINDKLKNKISSFFESHLFRNEIINIYKEHEFIFIKNDIEYRGIIDLILEYKDKLIIVDFKLSDLNRSEYIDQLNVYNDFLKQNTNKKIEAYLYSILNGEFKKVI